MIVISRCETGETRYTACVNGIPYNTVFKNERSKDDTTGDIYNLFDYISNKTNRMHFSLDAFSFDNFKDSRFKREDMLIIQSSKYLQEWIENKHDSNNQQK